MTWQDRIVRFDRIQASELTLNPKNARKHPDKQREALRGSLDTLGWYDAVILNQRTGLLIDGHARVEEALQAGGGEVPVLVVDLDEHEEAQALASHDFITYMAEYDREQLSTLLDELQSDDARVQEMLSDLAEREGIIPIYSLDELGDNYGGIENDAFNRVIRITVTEDQYSVFLEKTSGADDAERFFDMLERV